MKKLAILVCMLIPVTNVFAYYGDYGYSQHSDELTGFGIFYLIVMIVYIILSIVILIRWWKMTTNVEKISKHITHGNPKLTYLVAIGEKEQAQKAALIMLVDELYAIYNDKYQQSKAYAMNNVIQSLLPKMQKLGLSLPDYVTSGENFINYINTISGRNVQYGE